MARDGTVTYEDVAGRYELFVSPTPDKATPSGTASFTGALMAAQAAGEAPWRSFCGLREYRGTDLTLAASVPVDVHLEGGRATFGKRAGRLTYQERGRKTVVIDRPEARRQRQIRYVGPE